MPSRSIEVRRISPAPRRSPSAAQATASRPVARRPPCEHTSQPEPSSRRLASIASTTHCDPKISAQRVISAGSASAEELTDTLSAPWESSSCMSSTERTPPPTVRGMKTWSAVRATTSRRILRSSDEAVMSR